MTTDTTHTGTPEQPERIHYRADIDGLRAIAVLSVVGFHAFPSRVVGGFTGVDIFFVISGFLISTIIVKHLDRSRFSLVGFYSRRIRRIFPSLLVVLIASMALGSLVLTTEEYRQLGTHVEGGAGFVSNFILWAESGYFDSAAEAKPLLHLWSLGIEEQYYIAWPPLLWFAWKRNVNILAIAMALFVSSFALNMSIIQSDAVAAFYSPLTRVWELMVGSILACVLLRAREGLSEGRAGTKAWSSWMSDAFNAQQASKAWCNTQSFVGCALIGVGIVTITTDQPFPGTWALLPTAGSALVIVAGAHAWMNRVVLSNRVLVWFGLISFPLYLWHWPLLSFARIVEGATPAREIRIAAVLLSIVLAWATYRFVEWPIRRSDEQLGKKAFRLAALMLVVGCAGYGVPRLDAFSWRAAAAPPITNEGDIAPRSVADYVETHFHACTSIEVRQERCFQSQESGPSTIAIVGDSHAEDLFVGMSAALSQQNVLLYVRDELPLAGTQAFKDWLNYVLTDEDIRTVILTAYWFGRISSVSVDRSLESELAQTVQLLTEAGKRVYVGDDVPQFSFYPEKCKYARRFSQNSCLEDREFFFQRRQDYLPLLEALERDNSEVRVLRMSEYFCDATNCSMARDGQVLYRDSHHLNVNGSMFLGPLIVEDNPALRD